MTRGHQGPRTREGEQYQNAGSTGSRVHGSFQTGGEDPRGRPFYQEERRARTVDLPSSELAALRATGQTLDVAFQVGKNGVTEGVVKELVARLEREPLVKVKLLKGAREDASTKEVAQGLAEKAGAVLVEVRGFTALFYRPRRGRRIKA